MTTKERVGDTVSCCGPMFNETGSGQNHILGGGGGDGDGDGVGCGTLFFTYRSHESGAMSAVEYLSQPCVLNWQGRRKRRCGVAGTPIATATTHGNTVGKSAAVALELL